jgi:two-component system chemotaxis response regulator CheB
VVIGASTGGPDALTRILPELPRDFPCPIVVAVHMPGLFTTSLAQALNTRCSLKVVEATEGVEPQAGTVYLAPGERHVVAKQLRDGPIRLHTLDEPPVDGCRPSVDILFRSAARLSPRSVVAVILTGMGTDGTDGLTALAEARAHVIAQDEESSVVWGMPGSAVKAGVVDEVLTLDRISVRLTERVTR